MAGGGLGRSDGTRNGLFGSTGWLFADLMLALVMAFLVANTFGQAPPPKKPKPPKPTTPPPTTLPVLHLQPIVLNVTVDYRGLLAGDRKAVAAAQRKIRSARALKGKRAGLVLSFGGASFANANLGRSVARAFNRSVLVGLGRKGYVFKGTVYREMLLLGRDPSNVEVDVYVFKN